jgi:DNA polymerase I
MNKRIIIIDGNSLLNRAYYAMQRPMITKEGLYTQGVYGFLNMLQKIKRDYESGYIAVAFDRKAPTFRHLEFEDYKAGRKKMPPELAMQLPLLKEVLEAMKIQILEIDGFEADDIIGTVSREAEENGLIPLIITGDKDELQLASESTKVIITRKGISEFEIYDYDAMVETYGFPPTQFIDYKGLMGDPSDNIPGLPGVGEKTARKLVIEYGTIENLLEHVEEIQNQRLRQIIEDNQQQARMSKRLATIVREVPIEVDFTDYLWEAPDKDKLVELYLKLEFNSLLKKLTPEVKTSLDAPVAKATVSKNNTPDAQISFDGLGSEPDFQKLNEANLQQTSIVEHTSVGSMPELFGFIEFEKQIRTNDEVIIKVFSDGSHVLIPTVFGTALLVQDKYYFIEPSDTIELVRVLTDKNIRLLGHDLKEDYYPLFWAGMTHFNTRYDTAIAQYLLDSSRSNYSLKVLAQEYCRQELSEGEDLKANGYSWCSLVNLIKNIQEPKISSEGMTQIYEDVELPLIEPMAYLEYIGFTIDEKELRATGASINKKIEEITKIIHELAGETFNINSPAQLGPILFDKLGLPTGKKTKTGYSTNAEVLENLRDKHEIVALILEYRMLTKLRGTYIDGLLPLIHTDGKIHAHFNQTVAATGRISSNEPNLQNIPIRQEPGRSIRKAFVPSSSEYILMGADYSQIELRILAHLSQDPVLIEAFNSGDDIHKITAANVLGVPEDQITIADRTKAKAVNFGVIYGMSAFGLSSELNIPRKEADIYIKEYFAKHQKVKEFMDSLVASAKEYGYVTTILGRKRFIPEISASNYMVRQLGERLAMNSPIQGSAADIIKIAMLRVYTSLRDGNFKSRLILQVHDELILEVHQDEIAPVTKLLQDGMENAIKLDVKVDAALHQGINWYDLK